MMNWGKKVGYPKHTFSHPDLYASHLQISLKSLNAFLELGFGTLFVKAA